MFGVSICLREMNRGFRLYGILKIAKRTTISDGKLLEPDPCIWNIK